MEEINYYKWKKLIITAFEFGFFFFSHNFLSTLRKKFCKNIENFVE